MDTETIAPDEAPPRTGRGELTYKQAQREILAILDRIPDSQLPKPDRIESRGDGQHWAWFGGHGFGIRPTTGAASRRERGHGLIEAFQWEWLRRERERRYGKRWEFRDGVPVGGASS